jgi:hypothetical protein
LGSHGRRLPGRLVAAACLLIALTGCGSDDKIDLLPTGISVEENGSGTSAPAGEKLNPPEKPPKAIRTVLVEEAKPFLKEAFLPRFCNKKKKEVNEAFRILWEMFVFPNSDGTESKTRLSKQEVDVLREELIKTIKRAKSRGQRQFIADVETFLVFSAAFEKMDSAARRQLFEQWIGSIGEGEPSRPLTTCYSLFWLRETLQIWTAGGKSWWWANYALRRDPSFSYSKEKGARYEGPDGTIYCSRR